MTRMTVARLLVVASAVAAPFAHADCWVVGELAGASINPSEATPTKDGMTGQTFKLTVSGKLAAVSPSDLTCGPIGDSMAVCIGSKGSAWTAETWSVDRQSGRVIHTNNRTASGPYSGGRLFVGKVLSRCE